METTNKLDKFYDEVMDIMEWAEEQNFIREEAKIILIRNITADYEEIKAMKD